MIDRRRFLKWLGMGTAAATTVPLLALKLDPAGEVALPDPWQLSRRQEALGEQGIYQAFKEAVVQGQIDLDSGEIKCALLSGDYEPDLVGHRTLADIEATEIEANGYTAGGAPLERHNDKLSAQWEAVDGEDPKYLVTYDVNGTLVGYWKLPPTATNGGDLLMEWPGPMVDLT